MGVEEKQGKGEVMAKAKGSESYSVDWSDKGEYEVRFMDGIFDVENPALAEMLRGITNEDEPSRVMLVADTNVVHRTEGLGTRIGKYVQEYGIRLVGGAVVIGGGEKIKADGMQSVMRVATSALDAKIGANDVIIAIGGGTIFDVAGYAASQVRGGVKLVRVPTTPASIVDAAFADTAALDSQNVKDAMKVPCRPAAVAIDVSFVETVLDGVWRGGVGEMIRHAVTRDSSLLKKLSASMDALRERDMDAMREMLSLCVQSRVKKGSSTTALWSALRLESMSGYKLPHGYAVPMGLCIDSAYALEKGELKDKDNEAIVSLLTMSGALDGLAHSRHLLHQVDSVLFGLDAWRLSTGSRAIAIPSGMGKTVEEKDPDRELMRKVVLDMTETSNEE